MKILRAEVNWQFGYANSPELKILVDKLPTKFLYQEIPVPGGIFYLAETEGEVRFFVSTSDKHGYGGGTFDITLISGEKRSVKGPWSSRAGVANYYLPNPCLSCALTNEKEVFDRGYTFFSGHVLVSKVEEYLQRPGLHWELHKEEKFEEKESYWIPRLKKSYHKDYLESLGIEAEEA